MTSTKIDHEFLERELERKLAKGLVRVTHLTVLNVTEKAIVFYETKEVAGDDRRRIILPRGKIESIYPALTDCHPSTVVTVVIPKWLADDRELHYT